MNEGTNSESWEGRAALFHGKSACYGAVIPFREGKQTKSQTLADKHGEKLSSISAERQPGAMKPVCFQTLHTLPGCSWWYSQQSMTPTPQTVLALTLHGRGGTQTGSDHAL